VLRSLPDQPLVDLAGSQRAQAVVLYEQALAIFRSAGQAGSAAMVEEALAEVMSELKQPLASSGHAAASLVD
jgi:hypothetical protein